MKTRKRKRTSHVIEAAAGGAAAGAVVGAVVGVGGAAVGAVLGGAMGAASEQEGKYARSKSSKSVKEEEEIVSVRYKEP